MLIRSLRKPFYPSHFKQEGIIHHALPVVVVVVVAIMGTGYLVASHADSPAITTTPTPVKTGLLASGLTNSGGQVMCAAPLKGGTANSTPVVIDPCSRTDSTQQWTLYSDNTIRTAAGKCIGVQHAGTTNGTIIDIYTCNGSTSQVWIRGNNPSLSLNDLISSASGSCMDVFGSATANDSEVDLWQCNYTPGQVWGWSTSGTVKPGGSTGLANCHNAVVGGNTCYYWVIGLQKNNGSYTASGISADLFQAEPAIDNSNGGVGHTLFEIYAATADGKQAIELGWICTPSIPQPQLFVTWWLNGQFEGYNLGTGFVQLPNAPQKVNANVTVGAVANYKLKFANNQWQVWYNNNEVGYYPESLWSSKGVTFTTIANDQVFGESEGNVLVVNHMQMGNGVLGTLTGSATVSNYQLINSTTPGDFSSFSQPKGAAAQHYDYGHTSTTGFRLGGPGY